MTISNKSSKKSCAIHQSNYIPWKGYFDLIGMVDEFIIFDTVQFTKNDWRNRNRIKTPRGIEWLTIPVEHHFGQKICATRVANKHWNTKHWKTLCQNYSHARFFDMYEDTFRDIYLGTVGECLSTVNYNFLNEIMRLLNIGTKMTWSHQYELIDGKTERLVHLCKQAGAGEYLSGPSGIDYIEKDLFDAAGIKLSFMDYAGYPEYSQLYPPFVHAVTIIDLIFNEGPAARNYMKA